ncbi:MAG TPA: ATP-dependent DNA helicase RecG [Euzebyales bacterium]|nr:ATP-dependent DNA helicase RecG [Euzebyales bacterium]
MATTSGPGTSQGSTTARDPERWLAAPVGEVPGVSAAVGRTLRTVFGIETVRDLLEHYPVQGKYRDLGAVVEPSPDLLGEQVTVVGTIAGWQVISPRGRRMKIAKARVHTTAGAEVEAPFFNQEWRPRRHPAGSRVALAGTLEQFRKTLQLKNARLIELDPDGGVATEARIVATYRATEKLPSSRIAALVQAALDGLGPLPDFLPERLRDAHGLTDLDTALRTIHRPTSLGVVAPARDRLVYDELLTLQVGLQQRRLRLETEEVGLVQPPGDDGLAALLLDKLPFAPTEAQRRAFAELGRDLGGTRPMHRLLQGDVGAGKTLVAAWAMLTAVDQGHQAALMAPTEVLAEQHLRTFEQLLGPLSVNMLDGPRLALVTGSTTTAQLRAILAQLAAGDIQMVVGTHALLEERVMFADLGVVIVDEQHRFGVRHRARLKEKRADGRTPDVLVMTATPIPRSLALTVYGDLDVTVLDELPPGRQPVTTAVLPSDSPRRDGLYAFIRERAAAGERAYVVCPLVADSEVLDVASAVATYEHLAERVFPDLRVALVHGQMSSADKDAAMVAFRTGEAQILVATTVIEVGVDVPEATIMVIEDADRFGLSQLHQLRGRVGRGAGRSYCVLFSQDPDDNERLRALATISDGFKLAEVDLKLRGEGSLFDTRQSGVADLKLAQLIRDQRWVAVTRDDARALVTDDLDLRDHPVLAAEVERRYGERGIDELETS